MHWNDIEKITSGLEETYSGEIIPENNLSYLQEMVLSLPEFEDHEIEVEESRLKQIAERWVELRSENQ